MGPDPTVWCGGHDAEGRGPRVGEGEGVGALEQEGAGVGWGVRLPHRGSQLREAGRRVLPILLLSFPLAHIHSGGPGPAFLISGFWSPGQGLSFTGHNRSVSSEKNGSRSSWFLHAPLRSPWLTALVAHPGAQNPVKRESRGGYVHAGIHPPPVRESQGCWSRSGCLGARIGG